MKKIFMPDFYVTSIYAIDFVKLKERGIKNLIIDIDNTLVAWRSIEPDENAKGLINELKMLQFKICLLSNSSRKRVIRFVGNMDVDFFSLGIKPMRIMFLGALKKLNGKPSNTCVIGDQIFTDIVGGNRCGICTILVDPISNQEFFSTKYIRIPEKKAKKALIYDRDLMKRD